MGSRPSFVCLPNFGGGFVVNTTAGFLSVVTNVTVVRVVIRLGISGLGTPVGFDHPGTSSVEQEPSGEQSLGGTFGETSLVDEAGAAVALDPLE